MAWKISTSNEFDRWFVELSQTPEGRDALIAIDAAQKVLRIVGPTLGRPIVDTLKGSRFHNMKELRAKTSRMVIRIAFAFDPTQEAILLVGGDKSGVSSNRFYDQLIKRADRIYAEHLEKLRKKNAPKK